MNASPPCLSRKAVKAFTLVELLVVMAIIAVLVSMLFPTFQTTKEQGRVVQCKNNLRQLWVAFQAYAQDHRGRIPANSGWQYGNSNVDGHLGRCWINGYNESWGTNAILTLTTGSIYPYLQDIRPYVCPSMPEEKGRKYVRSYELPWYLGNNSTTSYNSIVDENGNSSFRAADTFMTITRPSQTLMLIECSDRCDDGWYSSGNTPGFYHFGKSPVLYVDGHVDLCGDLDCELAKEGFFHMPDPSKKASSK